MRPMSDFVVVEVARRGRLVVGEPYFTPGVPIVLDRKGLADVRPGELAVVRKGRGRARVERAIGPADRIETVLEALLEEEGMRRRFEPFTLPEPSVEGRVDLRDLITFTIDPETAKDFDRAVSVYVPGLVAPMLPHELADDACSLRPHLDRLCVTVEVPFDGALEAGEPTFYRSVIRSDARLTYLQAERILAGQERVDDNVAEAVALADKVSLQLRRRRFARGALRISSAELAFEFDGEGGVEKAWLETEPHAHALIEEQMILANEAVAGLLAGRGRETLYRVHEKPDPQSVLRLLAKLADLEVPTPPAPDADRLSSTDAARSEEHTSELQSREKLVCR